MMLDLSETRNRPTAAMNTAALTKDSDFGHRAMLSALEKRGISPAFLFLHIKPGNDATQYPSRYQEAFEALELSQGGIITTKGREFLDYVEDHASPYNKKLKQRAQTPVPFSCTNCAPEAD